MIIRSYFYNKEKKCTTGKTVPRLEENSKVLALHVEAHTALRVGTCCTGSIQHTH